MMCAEHMGSSMRSISVGAGRFAGLSIQTSLPVRHDNAVNYAGRSGNKIKIKFAFESLLCNFHMQKPEETAAEAVAECLTGFGFKTDGSIVQNEFLKRIAQVFVIRTVGGINSAEYHGVCVLIAVQRLLAGFAARVIVSPTLVSATDLMDAEMYPTSPAESSSVGLRLGENTPTSVTSNSLPVCMKRILSPARTTPSMMRT